MSKQWSEDPALLDAISASMFGALTLLPKRLIRLDAITRAVGMPFSQVQVLCLLDGGEVTVGEISTTLGVAKPNVTPLVDALCTRGLAERIRSDSDKRVVHVRLTPGGCDLAARVRQCIAQQVEAWPAALSHSEIKRLNAALGTLLRAANALAGAE